MTSPRRFSWPLAVLRILAACATLPVACSSEVLVGEQLGRSTGTEDSGPDADADADDADDDAATPPCRQSKCAGNTLACGDCTDNDGDGLVDMDDPDCLGPCHNAENTFFAPPPGQNNFSCEQECYFDKDSGVGNDGCQWSRSCDELNTDATAELCTYDPNATISGQGPPRSCGDLQFTQTEQCRDTCLPLTPNGCDCFGCCLFPGMPHAVWLGSVDDSFNATCRREVLTDPAACRPCTQVDSCVNPCDRCELCVGKQDLPPDCGGAIPAPRPDCDDGAQPCGLAGLSSCDTGFVCVTGCCVPEPR